MSERSAEDAAGQELAWTCPTCCWHTRNRLYEQHTCAGEVRVLPPGKGDA